MKRRREAQQGGQPLRQMGGGGGAARMGSSQHSRGGGGSDAPEAPKLTTEQSREAIKLVLAEVKKPANMAKIETLKKQVEANPDNAMMAMMQLIPMANQMLAGVMDKYGFNEENGGVMKFLSVLQASDDEEVQKTAKEVRALVVPASMLPMVEAMFGGNSQAPRDL